MKILENKLESMKILKNKLESMKILENKLESLKLQENQPVDGLVFGGSIWRELLAGVFGEMFWREYEIVENHREEEDQQRNKSPEIETLTYHVLSTYG
ncbi:hypothetical protein Tco_1546921 [Tanacetum coccineum]